MNHINSPVNLPPESKPWTVLDLIHELDKAIFIDPSVRHRLIVRGGDALPITYLNHYPHRFFDSDGETVLQTTMELEIG